MRSSFALVLLFPALAPAQDAAARKETVKWVLAREDPAGGFHLAAADPKGDAKPRPGLRATSGAVRALKYLGAAVPNKDRHAAFVLDCFDPKTGGFAEPGGKPDVTLTSVGVMGAVELGIPREKFAKAMDYLKENAKTFEDARIGAAAVEAWGVKDCPFDLKPWLKVLKDHAPSDPAGKDGGARPDVKDLLKDGGAREVASMLAARLRLEDPLLEGPVRLLIPGMLDDGQRADGGWGKKGEKASDLETTYRVMRTYHLVPLIEKPQVLAKAREFVAAHRNKDGGYAAKPGDSSGTGPTYYAVIISKWLDEMEKK